MLRALAFLALLAACDDTAMSPPDLSMEGCGAAGLPVCCDTVQPPALYPSGSCTPNSTCHDRGTFEARFCRCTNAGVWYCNCGGGTHADGGGALCTAG
jgi:hypothetical protein